MTSLIQTRSRTRRLSACTRHPSEPVTGFCASCLRERLSGFCPSADSQPSSSASDVFANARSEIVGGGPGLARCRSKAAGSSSYILSELRHSRSVTDLKCAEVLEPRRRSCEVKARNTLSDLFDFDDEQKKPNAGGSRIESKNLGFSRFSEVERQGGESGGKIGAFEHTFDGDELEEGEECRPMKEFIDLELQSRKQNGRDLKNIAGSFWEAASVFSKKLRNWGLNQKMRSNRQSSNGRECGSRGVDLLNRPSGRLKRKQKLRDTQSEVGDYVFGRRSCDTEPRFSVDAGKSRISVDDPRLSFDEPRASWDGYLIARTIPRLTPMLTVVENGGLAPITGLNGHQVSKEGQMDTIDEFDMSSSGSAQTNTNSDTSSSQRRSSFERSTSAKDSFKKTSGVEVDRVKSVSSNSKVDSPANADSFESTRMFVTEKELRDWNLSSFSTMDCLERYEGSSKSSGYVAIGDSSKGFDKFSRWHKVLGFLHEHGDKKAGKMVQNLRDHEAANDCERLGWVAGGVEKNSNRKLVRCASRNAGKAVGSSYMTRGSVASDACNVIDKERRLECGLQRNRSVRYSSNSFGSGVL